MSDNKKSYEDDLLNDISKSIAKQVNDEMNDDALFQSDDNDWDDDPLAPDEELEQVVKKKKLPLWGKVCISILSVMLVVTAVGGGYIWYLLNQTNFRSIDANNVDYQNEAFDKDDEGKDYQEANPDDIKWGNTGNIKKVNGVVNILLAAQEQTDGSLRGRTDVLMIATINTIQKSIKLTSIMRDTYVQIPGYKDNRINSAYRTGDIPLLEKTIETNFNIDLDGYILVDFDSFEKVIDELGGVEITLTKEEAAYLNRTNYISDKSNRHVKEGKQILNGNQAVGYCRVRKVRSASNDTSDFGRITRHKAVLTALFDKYKSQSVTDILGMADDILELVTTDITPTQIMSYTSTVLSMGVSKIETFSVPIKNAYAGRKIRGMAVLVPDLVTNNQALHEFIFGEEDSKSSSSSSSNSKTRSTYSPIPSPTRTPAYSR